MLEKFGVITGIMPEKEGWRYEQPMPEGGVQRLPPKGCAGTDAALVEMVKMFRIQANIDLGEPALDVAEYIKRVSPMSNRFRNKKTKHAEAKEAESLQKKLHRPIIERIKDWLLVVGRKEIRLLIEDEADERAGVCIQCRQNIKWTTGCVPCCEAIISRGQNVRQRPSYKHDDALGACRLHDFKISTAVFIDREQLPALNPNAPEECWMRKAT